MLQSGGHKVSREIDEVIAVIRQEIGLTAPTDEIKIQFPVTGELKEISENEKVIPNSQLPRSESTIKDIIKRDKYALY